MNARTLWSRILKIVGGFAMLVGTLDLLEGNEHCVAGGACHSRPDGEPWGNV